MGGNSDIYPVLQPGVSAWEVTISPQSSDRKRSENESPPQKCKQVDSTPGVERQSASFCVVS